MKSEYIRQSVKHGVLDMDISHIQRSKHKDKVWALKNHIQQFNNGALSAIWKITNTAPIQARSKNCFNTDSPILQTQAWYEVTHYIVGLLLKQ